MKEIDLTPEMFLSLLEKTNFNYEGLKRMKRFENVKFNILGDLNLSNTKIKKLFDININGLLDISRTKIAYLPNVKYERLRYFDTPYEELEKKRILQAKYESQNLKRIDNEWDIENTDEESEMVNAVFKYSKQRNDIEVLNDDQKERVKEIEIEIQDLENQQENLEVNDDESYSDKYDEIQEKIDELTEELEDLRSDTSDVYDFYEQKYHHYDMKVFECLTNSYEYAVSTEDDAESSLRDYYETMIDEGPQHYFNSDYLESYINISYLQEYFEEDFRNQIYDDPSSYDIELELSSQQLKEIEKLKNEIQSLEIEKYLLENGARHPLFEIEKNNMKSYKFQDAEKNIFEVIWQKSSYGTYFWAIYMNGVYTNKIEYNDPEDFDEDWESENEGQIENLEQEIEQLNSEVEEIEENPDGEPKDESVEETVEDKLDEVRRDPMWFIRNYGLSLENYIDESDLLSDLISNGSFGDLSSYDGDYDIYNINGTSYVVMRIN